MNLIQAIYNNVLYQRALFMITKINSDKEFNTITLIVCYKVMERFVYSIILAKPCKKLVPERCTVWLCAKQIATNEHAVITIRYFHLA